MYSDIKEFGGFDNCNPPASIAKNRFEEMSGCEVMNHGAVRRAIGCRVFSAGVGRHSIHSDGASLFFLEGTGLYRMDGTTPALLDSQFSLAGGRTTYYTHFDRTYYSDNLHNGVLQAGVARSWGLEPPPLPAVVDALGDLIHGRYHVGVTYLRADGQESGTSGLVACDSTGGLGISVAASADPGVTSIGVYVTTAGGDVPFLQALLPNQAWTGIIGSGLGTGRPLDTNLCSKPSPCSIIEEYHGRLYLPVGPTLFFTRSGNQYELVGPLDKHFLPIGDEITNVMPVEDGIWITTLTSSMFLLGADPHEGPGFQVRSKQKIGGVRKSGRVVDADSIFSRVPLQGKVALWTSPFGVCMGGAGGYFKNITGDYYKPFRSMNGMSFVRAEQSLDQYVFGMLASDIAFSMTDPADTLSVSTDNVP